MERVLITGGLGFIGKELASSMAEDSKYEIHLLDRHVKDRKIGALKNKVTLHDANIADFERINRIVEELRPDYVIHLGAISAVAFSYENYIEVNQVNFVGTANLAEACRKFAPKMKQFIFSGTSEEYGTTLKNSKGKLTESSQILPRSPYAVSKASSDIYLKYLGHAYNFPYTVLRPFNTYGRKDSSSFFIERTITQMLTEKKVYLGNPDVVRDWLYVKDHVNGYLKALGNKKSIGKTINLCTGVGNSTKQTAEKIGKLTGFKGEIIWNATPPRPLEAKFVIGDNALAAQVLGWKPQYDLEKGLLETISFWK